MKILALDLGTKTGWAYRDASGRIEAGTWVLMTPKGVTAQGKLRFDRRLDARIPRLYDNILRLHAESPLDWLTFEDVRFASTTYQAHLWASLRGAVWLAAYVLKLQIETLDTSRLKVFAAGHGAATKDMMAAWLCKKCPNEFQLSKGDLWKLDTNLIIDDNSVDAIHLLLWAEQTLKNP